MDLTAALDSFASRLERLPEALKEEMQRIVLRSAGQLLAINRAYIEAGQTVDGQAIDKTGYSPAYKKFKQKYGKFKNTAFVDLKLTGAFLDSLELEQVETLVFHVIATDAKYAFLRQYGDLLGIREADLNDFIASVLQPELDAFIPSYLQAA